MFQRVATAFLLTVVVANDAHLNVSSEKPAFAQSRFGEAGCNVAFPKRLR
jgi:hypothetical protein